jgi:small basic protein (TIGR04137 family)
MSVDRTLRVQGGMAAKRSVLKRPERIALMEESGDFDPENDSPLGLPKTRVKRRKAGGGAGKKTEEPSAEEAAAPVEPETE